ncbi:MAG: hypothetical protein ACRCTA_01680 [Bacilli bacterium]
MLHQNVTRDLILLGLYNKKMEFYFNPSSTFLSSLASSIVMNLILNNKITIEEDKIAINDFSSIRVYNKKMIDYIKVNQFNSIRSLASELFLDTDFTMELFEDVISELKEEGLIEVSNKKKLILNKHLITLSNPSVVKESYIKLFETLFEDNSSQELIALTLLIDTFYDLDDFFDEEDIIQLQSRIKQLHNDPLYQDIATFKEFIDEFYLMIAKSNSNYFGV